MKATLSFLMAVLAACTATAGGVKIVVSPAEKVKEVRVIQRLPNDVMSINQRSTNAKPADEKGHFIVADLPPGVYDIYIGTDDHKIEGVDLNTGADKDEPVFHWWLPGGRLTADRYDPATAFEEGVEVTEEERNEAIRKKFRLDALRQCFDTLAKIKRFENFFRVIYASGTAKCAKALVELRRDGGHYGEQGDEVVWRSEIWTFTWANGAWVTQNRGAKVLQRIRVQRTAFDRFETLYDPAIGGINVKDGETATVQYTLPDVLDDKMGKVKTQP